MGFTAASIVVITSTIAAAIIGKFFYGDADGLPEWCRLKTGVAWGFSYVVFTLIVFAVLAILEGQPIAFIRLRFGGPTAFEFMVRLDNLSWGNWFLAIIEEITAILIVLWLFAHATRGTVGLLISASKLFPEDSDAYSSPADQETLNEDEHHSIGDQRNE